jgi:hypothetical protein
MMYNHPRQMTPDFPQLSGDQSDQILDLLKKSSELGGMVHPVTRQNLKNVLKITNSYYSNLIATDVDSDILVYEVVQLPSHGTISNKPPNIIYTPVSTYLGVDEFTFKANDGKRRLQHCPSNYSNQSNHNLNHFLMILK